MAQMMNTTILALKDLSDIRKSSKSVDQLIRHARHTNMRYSNDLKNLLAESLAYSTTIKDENLIANSLATRVVAELSLGKTIRPSVISNKLKSYQS